MPYLNVDDNFAENSKVDPLSDAAFRLHVAALCYSAKQMTDGFLTPDRPARLVRKFKPTALTELLTAELWHDLGDGCGTKHCPAGESGKYLIHDYLQWNKSAEWWKHKRSEDAARQAEWRAKQEAEKRMTGRRKTA